MLRLLAGFLLVLAFMAGCVVYEPGRYNYPRHHFPRYHYQLPPIHLHYYRGWRGMNQEFSPKDSVFLVNYQDEPLMCVDPRYVEPDNG